MTTEMTEQPAVLAMPKLTNMQLSIIKFVQDAAANPERGFRADEELPQTFSSEQLRTLVPKQFVRMLRDGFPSMLIWFHIYAEPLVVDLKDIHDNQLKPQQHRVRVFVQRIMEHGSAASYDDVSVGSAILGGED